MSLGLYALINGGEVMSGCFREVRGSLWRYYASLTPIAHAFTDRKRSPAALHF
jgi:hypothetical protein